MPGHRRPPKASRRSGMNTPAPLFTVSRQQHLRGYPDSTEVDRMMPAGDMTGSLPAPPAVTISHPAADASGRCLQEGRQESVSGYRRGIRPAGTASGLCLRKGPAGAGRWAPPRGTTRRRRRRKRTVGADPRIAGPTTHSAAASAVCWGTGFRPASWFGTGREAAGSGAVAATGSSPCRAGGSGTVRSNCGIPCSA